MASLKPKAYKSTIKPIWCPGCGHYSVLNALTKALAALEQTPENCVLVSGIGCSSRLPAYCHTYGFHGVHGRALPVATGIKIARPELNVIVTGGDGDGFSIGGNHFLHACRRNVDLVYIAMDNEIYGMTKGQASPTSPDDWQHSKLTPDGPEIRPFQPCSVALASGASFIARGYSGDPNGISKLIYEAIRHPGFAFVHVLSQCITYCPSQSEWKTEVHDEVVDTADPIEAARFLQAEDGFSKGIIYRKPRQIWPPRHNAVSSKSMREGFVL